METTTTSSLVNTQKRVITWATNYNNKMGCRAFVHIDLAPDRKPIRSEVERTIIEIRTADQSHPPVKKRLYDMMFIPFQQVTDQLAFSSHGMTASQLAEFLFNEYHPNFNWTTTVCIYFYQEWEEPEY